MINIFEVFLPQLLAYPNVLDPLNAEAAHMMQREPKAYEAKVKGKRAAVMSGECTNECIEYVQKYASGNSMDKEKVVDGKTDGDKGEEEEDHVMSDVSLSDEEDAAGDIEL